MDIQVEKTYDAPEIPEWFQEELERVIPSGILQWNSGGNYWELWRRVPGTRRVIEGPLTRWCAEDGTPLPLNQAFIDHIQRSARLGGKAVEEYLDGLDKYNQETADRVAGEYAHRQMEHFIRKYDLDTNKMGGCRLSMH